MKSQTDDPFGTIESAHDFVELLAETISQAKEELRVDVNRESGGGDVARRVDALRIALYKVEKLEFHLSRSTRILNDLRTLRRLLFHERGVTSGAESRPVASEKKQAAA